MRIFTTILIIITFGVSACTTPIEYIPDVENLKAATVNTHYFSKINILGGGVIGGPDGVPGYVIPDDVGVYIRNCQLPESEVEEMKPRDSNNYNCVEIYGIPTKPREIKIIIGGSMYGNMLSSATRFKKEYTLNVTKP